MAGEFNDDGEEVGIWSLWSCGIAGVFVATGDVFSNGGVACLMGGVGMVDEDNGGGPLIDMGGGVSLWCSSGFSLGILAYN